MNEFKFLNNFNVKLRVYKNEGHANIFKSFEKTYEYNEYNNI